MPERVVLLKLERYSKAPAPKDLSACSGLTFLQPPPSTHLADLRREKDLEPDSPGRARVRQEIGGVEEISSVISFRNPRISRCVFLCVYQRQLFR